MRINIKHYTQPEPYIFPLDVSPYDCIGDLKELIVQKVDGISDTDFLLTFKSYVLEDGHMLETYMEKEHTRIQEDDTIEINGRRYESALALPKDDFRKFKTILGYPLGELGLKEKCLATIILDKTNFSNPYTGKAPTIHPILRMRKGDEVAIVRQASELYLLGSVRNKWGYFHARYIQGSTIRTKVEGALPIMAKGVRKWFNSNKEQQEALPESTLDIHDWENKLRTALHAAPIQYEKNTTLFDYVPKRRLNRPRITATYTFSRPNPTSSQFEHKMEISLEVIPRIYRISVLCLDIYFDVGKVSDLTHPSRSSPTPSKNVDNQELEEETVVKRTVTEHREIKRKNNATISGGANGHVQAGFSHEREGNSAIDETRVFSEKAKELRLGGGNRTTIASWKMEEAIPGKGLNGQYHFQLKVDSLPLFVGFDLQVSCMDTRRMKEPEEDNYAGVVCLDTMERFQR